MPGFRRERAVSRTRSDGDLFSWIQFRGLRQTWPGSPSEGRKLIYARVARWEGADAEVLEQTAAQIRADAESGPPEGVPAKGLLLLNDTEGGQAMAISLFETEEDYRQGDETLNASPPGEGMGRRVAVEKYEVAVQLEA